MVSPRIQARQHIFLLPERLVFVLHFEWAKLHQIVLYYNLVQSLAKQLVISLNWKIIMMNNIYQSAGHKTNKGRPAQQHGVQS